MRLYRLLLWLCPAALRKEYGAAMAEMFARRLADAKETGFRPRARLWRRELTSVLALAIAERWKLISLGVRPRRHWSNLDAMHALAQETRHAARRLLRSPAFSLAAVLTLALAIGANTAIFAVVERVVLNPLPYSESDRLVVLDHGAASLNVGSSIGITSGLYFHYADRARTLDGAALYRSDDLTITGSGGPERVRVTHVAVPLAPVLRASPAIGRWFVEAEGRPGAPRTAILSHGLWLRRYGGSPSVIGQSIDLEGSPAEIVGVMPASFAFPETRVDIWTPELVDRSMGFGLWGYRAVARLRDGSTLERARDELNGLIAEIPQAFPSDPIALGNTQIRLTSALRTLKEDVLGRVATTLWILLAAVGLVLLVACANVANLFLVRSEARQREIAVRRALGAGRLGITRYFLAESVLLSTAGGIAGIVLADVAVRLLVSVGPATLPRLHEIRLDAVTVAYTGALSLLTAILFGAIPLWRVRELGATLHENGRTNTASRSRHRVRQLLMGGQVAAALVLLVASGLMIRSFQNMRAIDPGFDATSTLTFGIGLPDRDYPTRDAAVAAHHAIIDRLLALPGVTAASATTCLPLAGGCFANGVRIEGRVIEPGTIPPLALYRAVAGGYFEAAGMRVIRGRAIDRADVEHRTPVAVVSQSLASKFFPNQDPIGRRVASNRPPLRPGGAQPLDWLTIVGVVLDTPISALGEANPIPQLYMPMSIAGGPDAPRNSIIGPDVAVMSFIVRTASAPLGSLDAVRRAVDGVDRRLALAQVRTLQDTLDRAAAQMAFTMTLIVIAGSVTLLLGVIGIYGVMSYIVSQRTGEIGVRLALGAEPGSVARMIVREGGVVAGAGIVAGLATAFAGSRLIESLLYGISPRDPAVFASTTAILLAVALPACWFPARRAARLSPLEALRMD